MSFGSNIKNSVLMWNQSNYNFLPGVPDPHLYSSGMHVKIPDMDRNYTKSNNFDFKLTLNGSEILQFIPVGKETFVNLGSSWPNPSFIGSLYCSWDRYDCYKKN